MCEAHFEIGLENFKMAAIKKSKRRCVFVTISFYRLHGIFVEIRVTFVLKNKQQVLQIDTSLVRVF